MGTESVEVQLARFDEQLKAISREFTEARIGRKEQYKSIEKLQSTIEGMNNRVQTVEKSLTEQAPTIEEFITIKHKVVGAGVAGKWLWTALAFLIGIIASAKMNIASWFS